MTDGSDALLGSGALLGAERTSFGRSMIVKKLPKETFVTGSTYDGEWGRLGMWGEGTYRMPHQVRYEGRMRDGEFHGAGRLSYPNGVSLDGIWMRGSLVKATVVFQNQFEYSYPFRYCIRSDRRYIIDVRQGFAMPAHRTDAEHERPIPEGCYDVGYGFFDPTLMCVFNDWNRTQPVKFVNKYEKKWIVEHCRKAWDEPVGYNPKLYEVWTNGAGDMPDDAGLLQGESDSNDSFESASINSLIF